MVENLTAKKIIVLNVFYFVLLHLLFVLYVSPPREIS